MTGLTIPTGSQDRDKATNAQQNVYAMAGLV